MVGLRRGRIWWLMGGLTLVAALVARSFLQRWSRDLDRSTGLPTVDVHDPTIQQFLKQCDWLVSMHRPMGPVLPDDWLNKHPEFGQSFVEFLAGQIDAPDANRRRLYIVPIGDMTETQRRIVHRTSEYLAACFGVTVDFLPDVDAAEVPPEGRRLWDEQTGEEQWQTTHLLTDIGRTTPSPCDCRGMHRKHRWTTHHDHNDGASLCALDDLLRHPSLVLCTGVPTDAARRTTLGARDTDIGAHGSIGAAIILDLCDGDVFARERGAGIDRHAFR
jgi:hypothetical protein